MDAKTLHTLEFDKVRERLAAFCQFAVSKDKARSLHPHTDLRDAREALDATGEARALLELEPQTGIGGARDIATLLDGARRGQVLTAGELLDVKSTLLSARALTHAFKRKEAAYPRLCELALGLYEPPGLVDAINRAISDRGDVLDSASEKLGRIRSELRVTHDRLLAKMQGLLTNERIAPHLQENYITQRDGRYVLPLKAESKGKIKSVVHDVSASGATIFAEPLQVVELNNDWRELQLAERDEELRVLAALSDAVGQQADALTGTLAAIADLDVIFAKAKYADALNATRPELEALKPPKDGKHPGLTLRLTAARHPLLDPQTVVAIDVILNESDYCLIITGPNTGGKTVTLKTVGLLTLMAQSGLHIPAEAGSALSLFKHIYADIGDEQSIEQSLSTFSGHITNIIKILKHADAKALVIIDELGAGTDPQEGAALARAILENFVGRGITTLVATHYPELKAYAHATTGVVNASVEFDVKTLRPTYNLTIGLPGRSNALSIATRLGLPANIIETAKKGIDPAELRADDLLDEIHRQREQARTQRAAAEAARREIEGLRAELNEQLEAIEDERLLVLDEARQQAAAQAAALEEEIGNIRRELARARQPLEALEQAARDVEELEERVEAPVERKRVREAAPTRRAIRLGDKVLLRTLGREGVVNALTEDEAEIMIGNLRVRVDLYDLDLVGEGAEEKKKPEKNLDLLPYVAVSSPGAELSLRGQSVDEAIEALERYLDSAWMAGLPYVRIVHGKGTGRLRDAVRRELKGHPHVERHEGGGPTEGGDGVTVAHLRRD
ncbi:MAG: endonuclease MutS2 [Anaerolineae bacterium]|nr:MAG: endonuclease MutS2 [Anaerolineae bacterium]